MRTSLLAAAAFVLSCASSELRKQRTAADQKVAAGCVTTAECRSLRYDAQGVLTRCEQQNAGCQHDAERLARAEALLGAAEQREREASEAQRRAEEERARQLEASRAAAEVERNAKESEREQLKQAERDEAQRALLARLATIIRMHAQNVTSEDAKKAAETIADTVGKRFSGHHDELNDLAEVVVLLGRRPGWKGSRDAGISQALAQMDAAIAFCAEERGDWRYRYFGVDEKQGVTCGRKQCLKEERMPRSGRVTCVDGGEMTTQTPRELEGVTREVSGLVVSVRACEAGRDPASLAGIPKAYACPR
jgi:hypothetical protein